MSNYVPGEGQVAHARLALLGEAPGQQEDEHLRPFVPWAPSGKVVTKAIGGEGGRAAAYLTNVRKALPPKGQAPAARLADLRRWHEELEQEFKSMAEARCVVLIGEDAFKAVLGSRTYVRPDGRRQDERAISLWHGSVLTRQEADVMRAIHEGERPLVSTLPPRAHTFVVSLHPAFALRGRQPFMAGISTNLRRAARWASLEAGPERPGAPSLFLEPAEVQAFLEHCEITNQPVAIDVETPEDSHGHILICGLAGAGKAMAFPWVGGFIEVIRKAMSRAGVFVGHNVAFDLNAFNAYGIRPTRRRRIVDTMVAAARLTPPFGGSEESRWLALASCVLRFCDGEWFWKKPDWATTKAIYRANWPEVEEWVTQRAYCALDCQKTLRLWNTERRLLEQEGML